MHNRETRRRRLVALLVIAAACGVGPVATGGGPLVRLGAIGDSLTDEYAEESYGWYARAWTELLIAFRGVSMGPTAAQAGVGWWGEPRRGGHEDNWARYGITSDGSISAGAHLGLAQGAMSRGVSHAPMFLGGNDFSPWAGAYPQIYSGAWSQTEIDDWISGRILNYRTVLAAVAPTGCRVTLCSVIDFSCMPYVWQGSFTDAAGRERVAAAMARFRDEARALADEYDLAFLDTYALTRAMFGPNNALRQFLPIGGVSVQMWSLDTTSGANPAAAWVDDGIHPNTVIQGVWASAIATAMNAVDGAAVAPFTEAEILMNAGLVYGGSNTLAGVIGPYTLYVRNFRCPGDMNGDGVVSASDIAVVLGAWGPTGGLTDLDGDGATGASDVAQLLGAWGPCGAG